MYNRKFVPRTLKGGFAENEILVVAGNADGNVRHSGQEVIWARVNKPGMNGRIYYLPLTAGGIEALRPYVDEFIDFASAHKEYNFIVSGLGTGYIGYGMKKVAPLFKRAIDVENIFMLKEFVNAIG